MITIISIAARRGYSPVDHLINDDSTSDQVGQQFASAREARRHIARTFNAGQHHVSLRGIPLAVVARTRRGDLLEFDA